LRFSKREAETMFRIPGLEYSGLMIDLYFFRKRFARGFVDGVAEGQLSVLFAAVDGHGLTAKEAYERSKEVVKEYGEAVRVALLAEMVDEEYITVQRAAGLAWMTEDTFERAAKTYERDVCLAMLTAGVEQGEFTAGRAEELRQATLKAYEIGDGGPSEA
jgi:hypothetical protein